MTTKDIDPLPFTPPDPNDRFWSKVAIRGPDECWEWLGTKNKGYGLFRVGQVKDIASRVAWDRAPTALGRLAVDALRRLSDQAEN